MAVTVAVAAVTLLVPGSAAAGAPSPKPKPVQVTGDNKGGYVTTVVQAPSTNVGAPSQQHNETVSTNDDVQCTWTENPKHLEDEYRDLLGWGEPGGHWYDIRCTDGSVYLSVYVPPAANNAPPPQALAASLAQREANRLPLPDPAIRHNPSGDALVNLSTWWWVDPQQWRPLSQRTSIGPVWARVTARPVKSVWDAGDGTAPLTCRGGGTPYDSKRSADSQASDCSHVYKHSSANQPQAGSDPNDRFFTVTVTVYWRVRFVGAAGAAGALPVMTRTSRFPLRVDERQTVVTGGSG